ncbi:MAG: hypothetical protein QOD84_1390 [Acidobacteriaceae bacterium]
MLAYCVTEAGPLEILAKGFAGRQITVIEHCGLQCPVATLASVEVGAGLAAREEVLAFHAALQGILRQRALIPFRFPTVFGAGGEVCDHLKENERKYHDALARVRNAVQMEVQISFLSSDADSKLHREGDEKRSGTAYLQSRLISQKSLEEQAVAIHDAVAPLVKDWRERISAQSVRAFALVDTEVLSEFEQALAALKVPEKFAIKASGPWPATEFLESKAPKA